MYIISRLKLFVKIYFQLGIKKPSNLAGLKKWSFAYATPPFVSFSVGLTHTLLLCVPAWVKDLSLLCPTTD